MEKSEFHQQFERTLRDVIQYLKNQKIKSEEVQLQIKYGYLKKKTDPQSFQQIENYSHNRPVYIGTKQHKSFIKVEAGCSLQEQQNARKSLNEFALKRECKISQKHYIKLAKKSQRYLYDCDLQSWTKTLKIKLIQNPVDFIYKGKLFKIGLSANPVQDYAENPLNLIKQKQGVKLRIQQVNIFKINKFFEIWSTSFAENKGTSMFNSLEKLLEQKEGIFSQDIKGILQNEYSQKIKRELELKFSPQAIHIIRYKLNNKSQKNFSQAFNFFAQINLKNTEPQISKLMSKLSISEKKNKRRELQRKELNPKNNQKTPKRIKNKSRFSTSSNDQ